MIFWCASQNTKHGRQPIIRWPDPRKGESRAACLLHTVLRRKERIRQPSIFEERRTSRGVGGSVETGVPFEAVS
jgi:hypothetical protein